MRAVYFLIAAFAVRSVSPLPAFTSGRDLGIRSTAQTFRSPLSVSMVGATQRVTNLTIDHSNHYHYSPPGDPSISVKFTDFRPRRGIACRQVQSVVNDIRHVAKAEYQAEGLGPSSPVDGQFFTFEWRYGQQDVTFYMGGVTGPPPDTRGILYDDLTGVLMDGVEKFWAWHGLEYDLPAARIWLWASRSSVLAGEGEIYANKAGEAGSSMKPVELDVT